MISDRDAVIAKWDKLCTKAYNYDLPVPDINVFTCTLDELNAGCRTLDRNIRQFVKAGGGASTSAPAAQEKLNS